MHDKRVPARCAHLWVMTGGMASGALGRRQHHGKMPLPPAWKKQKKRAGQGAL